MYKISRTALSKVNIELCLCSVVPSASLLEIFENFNCSLMYRTCAAHKVKYDSENYGLSMSSLLTLLNHHKNLLGIKEKIVTVDRPIDKQSGRRCSCVIKVFLPVSKKILNNI